jgi:hypothetical protein
MNVAENEPSELTLGETWQWRRLDLSADYPASQWTLKYYFKNAAANFALTAAAYNTKDYEVLETATNSATRAAGTYDWRAYVEQGAGNALVRHEVDRGKVVLVPNFSANGNLDQRTHARKVLESIEAVLEQRATLDQEEFTINNRSLKRTPLPELMKLRDRYRAMVTAEENAEAVANGKAPKNRLLYKL